MIEHLHHYLIIGGGAGFFGGLLGIGGGAIITPLLIFLIFGALQLDESAQVHLAVGTAMAVIAVVSVPSFLTHAKRGAVDWKIARGLVPGATAGALSALLARYVPGVWLAVGLATFLFWEGIRMTVGMRVREMAESVPNSRRLAAVGAGIGAISGMVGIGGGVLAVPYLARHGVALVRAMGTSAFMTFPLASAAAIGHIISGWNDAAMQMPQTFGYVHLPSFLGVAVAGIVFAPLGAMMTPRVPTQILRRIFGVILLLFASRLMLKFIF